jgi:hypothetical protein
MQNPVGHYAGYFGWTRKRRRFAAPDQMGGGDLIKGGTPDWPYPYPTFFGPWVVVTAGGQVKNVGLVWGGQVLVFNVALCGCVHLTGIGVQPQPEWCHPHVQGTHASAAMRAHRKPSRRRTASDILSRVGCGFLSSRLQARP